MRTRATIIIAIVTAAFGGCGKDPEGTANLGKPAELFGPLTKLRFGMRDTELVDAAPEFKIECVSTCRAKATVGGVEYTVRLHGISKRVYEMSAAFDGVRPDVVVKRWGAGPRVAKGVVDLWSDVVFYSNAARTMRAWVHSQTSGPKEERTSTYVTFRPLMPIDKMIDPQKLTVGGIELLGRPAGDVRNAATDRGFEAESGHLWLAPTELGGKQTYVAFDVENDVVTKYRITVPTNQVPDAKATILSTLARTFGQPTADASSKDIVYPVRGKFTVSARAAGDDVTITIAKVSEPT